MNLNSHRAMSSHIDDDIIHEGLPDLDGRVREISYQILSKAEDAAKDRGIERAVKGLAHPNFGDHWVILDEVGDMILLWKDIAYGALLEHASAEKLEAKEGRTISIVATKVFVFKNFLLNQSHLYQPILARIVDGKVRCKSGRRPRW